MNKLDRQQIENTALAMIATDGESGLAMRPLAARLGVTPMALYRYFADRDALLLALVERVSEDIDFPGPAGTPADRAVDLAVCLHDFLVQHSWMIRLISTGRLASPAGFFFPEGFLSCAFDAGLSEPAAFRFYRTMFATVIGQATITTSQKEGVREGGSVIDSATPATPVVQSLASRWRDLDAELTPRTVFRAVTSELAK